MLYNIFMGGGKFVGKVFFTKDNGSPIFSQGRYDPEQGSF